MLSQLVLNGLIAGAMIALLAVGFHILYASGRFFVFTFGASFAWGAYSQYALLQHVPHVAAAVGGLVTAAALGMLLECVIYRRLRLNKSSSLVLMLASIGAYIILQNVLSLTFGDTTKSVQTWPAAEGLSILGGRLTVVQVVIGASSVALITVTWSLLTLTHLGRKVRAVSCDQELASIVGLNVHGTILLSAMLGSAIAGAAGVLASLDTGLVPTMGFNALLLGVVACIVGGVDSFKGAVCGGILLGLIQTVGVWKVATHWQDLLVFSLLILVLLVRPQGLFGLPIKKAQAG